MRTISPFNLIPHLNNPSIRSIIATSKILSENNNDLKQQNEIDSNDDFKESFKTTKKHMISMYYFVFLTTEYYHILMNWQN